MEFAIGKSGTEQEVNASEEITQCLLFLLHGDRRHTVGNELNGRKVSTRTNGSSKMSLTCRAASGAVHQNNR